jgi:DNA-binding transcriptional ArsR family regulator
VARGVEIDGAGSRPVEQIATLNRLIHEPARLAILTALSACQSADFPFLARVTGLTAGNLSSHLTKLEEGGMLMIAKGYRGRVPVTTGSLTAAGRAAIDAHWEQLAGLRQRSMKFVADAGAEGTG